VLEIMGQPYLRTAEDNKEWLLYETGPWLAKNFFGYTVPATKRERFTPVFIQDDKLMGWGENFWATLEQKQRFEFKIR